MTAEQSAGQPVTPGGPDPTMGLPGAASSEISPRSRLVALLLCFFFGALGAHRFYLGKIGTGILMLLTLGGLGIWVLIDLILIIVGVFRDKQGQRVFRWMEPGSA